MDDSGQMRQMDARIAEVKEAEAAACQTRGLHPVSACAMDASPRMDASPSRMSARGVLEQRHDALLREANGIRALLQALPGSMGREAEEALWKIVIEQRL